MRPTLLWSKVFEVDHLEAILPSLAYPVNRPSIMKFCSAFEALVWEKEGKCD
jgi:hypothetical protein